VGFCGGVPLQNGEMEKGTFGQGWERLKDDIEVKSARGSQKKKREDDRYLTFIKRQEEGNAEVRGGGGVGGKIN